MGAPPSGSVTTHPSLLTSKCVLTISCILDQLTVMAPVYARPCMHRTAQQSITQHGTLCGETDGVTQSRQLERGAVRAWPVSNESLSCLRKAVHSITCTLQCMLIAMERLIKRSTMVAYNWNTDWADSCLVMAPF